MDNATLQTRISTLSTPIVIVFAGVGSMVKTGHINLWIALITVIVAYLCYLIRRRNISKSARRTEEIRARAEEYGTSRKHLIAGEALLAVMIGAETLAWLLFGNTPAMLAPLFLLAPLYVAIGVKAPRHATDAAPYGAIRLTLVTAIFACLAMAVLPAYSSSTAIVMRGGGAFCAILFAMILTIATLRRKGPFARILD